MNLNSKEASFTKEVVWYINRRWFSICNILTSRKTKLVMLSISNSYKGVHWCKFQLHTMIGN